LDRRGYVNAIERDAKGDRWQFEILFEEPPDPRVILRAETAWYGDDQLELIEASGLEHEPEIELDLETSVRDPAVVAADVLRVATDEFAVAAAAYRVDDERVRVQLSPRNHPRPAVQSLMARLGSSWLTEDDGWYANVTWIGRQFPVSGVDAARLFLRPWRDPRPGERLPGEPAE
jgi:hypothetical protein